MFVASTNPVDVIPVMRGAQHVYMMNTWLVVRAMKEVSAHRVATLHAPSMITSVNNVPECIEGSGCNDPNYIRISVRETSYGVSKCTT